MIDSDYRRRILSGEGLATVLEDRGMHDRSFLIQVFSFFLEHRSVLDHPGGLEELEQVLRDRLPELYEDPEILSLIHRERLRRSEAVGGGRGQPASRPSGAGETLVHGDYFGPLEGDGYGRYRIQSVLGRGGQGTVYRAVDRVFVDASRTSVAIKVLDVDLGKEAVRGRSVGHPGVVSVLDRGRDPRTGKAYIVQQYLHGDRLDLWMKRQTLSLRDAVGIALQLCEGVGAIHESMIVHRDLKPGNVIMIGMDPVIVDFGISVAEQEDWDRSMSPATVAPELVDGIGGNIRVDVYGLGVLMHFLFSGRLPTGRGESYVSVIENARLESIVLKCLSVNPADRYASAGAVADDLSSFLSHRPISTRRGSIFERAGMGIVRWWVPTSLVSVIFAACVILGLWQQRELDRLHREHTALTATVLEAQAEIEIQKESVRIVRRNIEDKLLGMKVGGAQVEPGLFWSIAELSKLEGMEDFTYRTLVTIEGAAMLRELVAEKAADDSLSRVTVGQLWWLLARIERAIPGGDPVLVARAYGQARLAIVEAVGGNDPLVAMLDAEATRIQSE